MPRALLNIRTVLRSRLGLAALRLGFRFGSLFDPAAAIRRAGSLFSTPLPSSRKRALAAPTGDALEAQVTLGDQCVHTYVWGDPATQPYVLFAHGWSSHATRFLPWVRQLRALGYAAVAFDQPAHGRSAGCRATLPDFTRNLRAIADRYGPAAAVVGHSLGGAAVATALAHGLQAERAVLIAPAGDPVAAAYRFARFIRLPRRLCLRMIAAFEATVGLPFAYFQAHLNAPRIARPALIVHDVGDREVPWSEGECYARHWPHARLLSTRGLGHNRIADDAGVIAAALRFLRGDEDVGERVVSSPNLPYGFA